MSPPTDHPRASSTGRKLRKLENTWWSATVKPARFVAKTFRLSNGPVSMIGRTRWCRAIERPVLTYTAGSRSVRMCSEWKLPASASNASAIATRGDRGSVRRCVPDARPRSEVPRGHRGHGRDDGAADRGVDRLAQGRQRGHAGSHDPDQRDEQAVRKPRGQRVAPGDAANDPPRRRRAGRVVGLLRDLRLGADRSGHRSA